MPKYIDLSQPFTSHMPAYPDDPDPELRAVSTLEKEGVTVHQVMTGLHVGTHIDAPLHMVQGKKMSDIPVERLCGTGLLIDARGKKEIGEELLEGIALTADHIVLVCTGFSKKFREDGYYRDHPAFTAAFAERLAAAAVKMVGMDTPSPDFPPFTVHKILLEAEVLIIENLAGLEQLAGEKEFEIMALPVKFEAEAGLARVVARIN